MIHIINTGGTFNKKYNLLDGQLYVPKDDNTIHNILKIYPNIKYSLKGIAYKDSIYMNDEDREEILENVLLSNSKKIIIIHGTDTMKQTASLLQSREINKLVILTGAMVPYEIDKIEASSNIAMCLGFMGSSSIKNGVYICMSGIISDSNNVIKNKDKGIFEYIESRQ